MFYTLQRGHIRIEVLLPSCVTLRGRIQGADLTPEWFPSRRLLAREGALHNICRTSMRVGRARGGQASEQGRRFVGVWPEGDDVRVTELAMSRTISNVRDRTRYDSITYTHLHDVIPGYPHSPPRTTLNLATKRLRSTPPVFVRRLPNHHTTSLP